MKARKAMRRLRARISDFDHQTEGPLVVKGKNFHRPGSLNK